MAHGGDSADPGDPRSVRERAFLKLARWLPLAVAVGYLGNWLQRKGYDLPLPELAAIPGALALCALLEWASGRRITELNQAWMGLRGWQRLVLGLLVVLLAFACIVGSLAWFLGDGPA
jgi:hypothetical protein